MSITGVLLWAALVVGLAGIGTWVMDAIFKQRASHNRHMSDMKDMNEWIEEERIAKAQREYADKCMAANSESSNIFHESERARLIRVCSGLNIRDGK